jgi:hypothetical protein
MLCSSQNVFSWRLDLTYTNPVGEGTFQAPVCCKLSGHGACIACRLCGWSVSTWMGWAQGDIGNCCLVQCTSTLLVPTAIIALQSATSIGQEMIERKQINCLHLFDIHTHLAGDLKRID